MTKSFLTIVLISFAMSQAFSQGYRVSLQGNQALGMGHTGVAVVNNAETAFFNPAGLVYLEDKLNVSAGAYGIFSSTKWQNTDTGQFSEVEDNVSTPFYLYASYKVNEWLTAGIASYTPFGSRVEWEKDWAGSHLVNDIELAAIFVQPMLSVKLSEHFSIGGGPIFATGNVNFNRNINRTLTDENGVRSNVTIDDSGVTNWGWSAGFMFPPTEKLKPLTQPAWGCRAQPVAEHSIDVPPMNQKATGNTRTLARWSPKRALFSELSRPISV